MLLSRERSACDKAEAALEGVKEELAAMHEAMASLHGEMGAMQREVRSTRFDRAEAKRSGRVTGAGGWSACVCV